MGSLTQKMSRLIGRSKSALGDRDERRRPVGALLRVLDEVEKAETAEEKRKRELYASWRSLVNMSPSEIRRFLESDEGSDAGMSESEASRANIRRGRDSARALLRMIPKGRSYAAASENWSANDWEWAGRQVSFISRMRGNDGPLTESDGSPTRKLKSLLIWGHDPRKTRKDVQDELAVLDLDSSHHVALLKAEGLSKLDPDEAGDLRLATGIVLEPDVVDAQGDTYSVDEIRKTAHLYMLDYQNVSFQHREYVNDKVKVVESWLVPEEGVEFDGTRVRGGTWVMTVKVFDDEIWRGIKRGDITGFSIEGFAKRTPVRDEPASHNPFAVGG